MSKENVAILITLGIILLVLGVCIGMVVDYPKPLVQTIISENRVEIIKEVPVIKERVVTVEVIQEVDRIPETILTEEEKILMARLIHAEAGSEDYIGKRLVADVILNRVDYDGLGDTVHQVIYRQGQFANPSSIYTEEDLAAVEAECYERLDYEILYFRAHYFFSGHPRAYPHGNHYFSYQ